MNKIHIFLLPMWLSVGCSDTNKQLDWQEYTQWMTQHKEVLIKSKRINQIDISCFYQPSEYLAYHDLLKSGVAIDSASLAGRLSHYNCGLTFTITMRADKRQTNLLYAGLASEQEYKQRVNTLHFHADEFISLSMNGVSYRPTLVNYEGYNELKNQLLFTAMFTPQAYACGKFIRLPKNITVTFDDPYWGMGTNHFSFNQEILTKSPNLVLEDENDKN